MNVLFAYASAHGATAEIAQFMGQVLKDNNFLVTVVNVDNMIDVDAFDVVILGSPIHYGMMLPEMAVYLRRNRLQLKTKQVYFWVNCIRFLEDGGLDHVLGHYVPEEAMAAIGARDVGVFAGRLLLEDMDMEERWAMPERYDGHRRAEEFVGDFRDWEAIRAWTNKIADELVALTG